MAVYKTKILKNEEPTFNYFKNMIMNRKKIKPDLKSTTAPLVPMARSGRLSLLWSRAD